VDKNDNMEDAQSLLLKNLENTSEIGDWKVQSSEVEAIGVPPETGPGPEPEPEPDYIVLYIVIPIVLIAIIAIIIIVLRKGKSKSESSEFKSKELGESGQNMQYAMKEIIK
jgi:hypothetical protein